jgi:hypothetical protein
MTTLRENPPPRWRSNSIGETAKAAAMHMKARAPTLRQRVLDLIEAEPATPEVLHERLRKQGVSTVLTAVRPRCSELARMGLITDSKQRGLAESGRCKAIIWRATSEAERAAWAAKKAAEASE